MYPDGADIPDATSISKIVPIDDWVPGEEPAWAPIAGGKGFGTPERSKGKPPVLYPGQSTESVVGGGLGGSSNSSSTNITPSSGSAGSGSSVASSVSAIETGPGGAPTLQLQNITTETSSQTSGVNITGTDTTGSATVGSDPAGSDTVGSAEVGDDEDGDECEAEL